MTSAAIADWDPGTYGRFRDLRLRPALDLLAQVPSLLEGDVIDLGCGAGAVGPALRRRFADRRIIGIDRSPAMLDEARQTGAYDDTALHDAADWMPAGSPALIFSNALCHWLPAHEVLFHHLAGVLAPEGTLAVQMPRQFDAPSHRLLRDVAARLFPDRFDFTGWCAPVAEPSGYLAKLAPFGDVNVWETEYYQTLAPVTDGHPVRHFTQSTAMRPITGKLSDAETRRFLTSYDDALLSAYPLQEDGGAILPFRRLFFVLTKVT